MKKVFVAGLIALTVVAISRQQASAWHNNKFSIGLNWECQSGNNNCFWGAFHNGQLPGPEAYGYGDSGRSHFHTQPQYYHGYTHHHHAMGAYEMPGYAYTQPVYATPYQFATYPRPAYYYPTPSYYYGE